MAEGSAWVAWVGNGAPSCAHLPAAAGLACCGRAIPERATPAPEGHPVCRRCLRARLQARQVSLAPPRQHARVLPPWLVPVHRTWAEKRAKVCGG